MHSNYWLMWAHEPKEKTKAQHNIPPQVESQTWQRSAGRGVLSIQERQSRNVSLFPWLASCCRAVGSVVLPAAGNGVVGRGDIPFLPPELPVPWHGALLGWPWGAQPLPGPLSPAGHPNPSLPGGTGIGACHAPPKSFPFFCGNCLNLIGSSSAHHSSLYDDTNQVVGGFVMAVSDTLIKASSFGRRKYGTI